MKKDNLPRILLGYTRYIHIYPFVRDEEECELFAHFTRLQCATKFSVCVEDLPVRTIGDLDFLR